MENTKKDLNIVIKGKSLKMFHKVMKYQYTFNKEVFFKFSTDGITLLNMCPANVSMNEILIKADICTEYNINKEINICIDLSNLNKYLKNIKKDSSLNLSIDSEALNLNCVLDDLSFNIGLIDSENNNKVPELMYNNKFNLLSNNLFNSINNIKRDIVSFKIDSDGLKSFIGDSMHDIKNGLNTDYLNLVNDSTINLKSNDIETAYYSFDYLKKLKNILPDGDINLNFNADYPLLISFNDDYLNFKFILAPKVGDD